MGRTAGPASADHRFLLETGPHQPVHLVGVFRLVRSSGSLAQLRGAAISFAPCSAMGPVPVRRPIAPRTRAAGPRLSSQLASVFSSAAPRANQFRHFELVFSDDSLPGRAVLFFPVPRSRPQHTRLRAGRTGVCSGRLRGQYGLATDDQRGGLGPADPAVPVPRGPRRASGRERRFLRALPGHELAVGPPPDPDFSHFGIGRRLALFLAGERTLECAASETRRGFRRFLCPHRRSPDVAGV